MKIIALDIDECIYPEKRTFYSELDNGFLGLEETLKIRRFLNK
jgi:hypothetical protein